VQDGEEANLRAQVFGVGSYGAQSLGRGLEEMLYTTSLFW